MDTVWDRIHGRCKVESWPPHPKLPGVLGIFRNHQVARVLDLGCGAGRHTVALAAEGFDVWGLDSSAVGLADAMMKLSQLKRCAHFVLGDMTALPYRDDFFDAIISIQVIHHNRLEAIHRTVGEAARVLRPGGLLWVTLPISKNEPSKHHREIEPGTFIPLDGPEKGLPHHYFRKWEIPSLFQSFQLLELETDSFNHHSLLGKKRV